MQSPVVGAREMQRLRDARERLVGQLVRTPVVGGIQLESRPADPRLRAKLEVLQPGGSAEFRGAMHALGRSMGTLTGLVVGGAFRSAFATAVAASMQRIPTLVLLDPRISARRAARFEALPQVEVERVVGDAEAVATRARREGWSPAPGPGDPEWRVGVATLGLELGEQMPGDTDLVVVGPGSLRRGVEQGLAAQGVSVEVAGADPDLAVPEGLRRALRDGLRVDVGDPGLRAFETARRRAADGADVVVVLGA